MLEGKSEFLLEEDTDAPSELEVFLPQKVSRQAQFAFKAKNPTSPTGTVVCSHLDHSALIPSVGKPKGTAAQVSGETCFNTLSVPPRKLPLSHYPPAFLTKVLSSALKAFGSLPPIPTPSAPFP